MTSTESFSSTPTTTSGIGTHDVSGGILLPGGLYWWMFRAACDPALCNVTWSSGGAGEAEGRDTALP